MSNETTVAYRTAERPICICEPQAGAFEIREPGCRAHDTNGNR